MSTFCIRLAGEHASEGVQCERKIEREERVCESFTKEVGRFDNEIDEIIRRKRRADKLPNDSRTIARAPLILPDC